MKKNVLLSALAAILLLSPLSAVAQTKIATIPMSHLPMGGVHSPVRGVVLPEMVMPANKSTKIQVAILLDTSSSMDGLIEQAKSRLWNIVNTLTTLKYNGQAPQVEIALYEYGNSGLSSASGYIRQVAPMTTDLDLISEKLFSLTTNGGLEYCGAVIDQAVKQLDWGRESSDMKLIYIAGNEEFTQGNISYKEAINDALKNDIFVNTIHCGGSDEGIRGMWADGAARGKGKYFYIDQNARVRYIVTPYDDRISRCNDRLNGTYIGYGSLGYAKQESQKVQDSNARGISSANYAERAVSKSSKAYKNSSWDLVDKVKENRNALAEIKEADLPTEYQGKSKAELEKVIAEKQAERETIQKEIAELAKQRQEYIDTESKKQAGGGDDLGAAISQSVIELANARGYVVGK